MAYHDGWVVLIGAQYITTSHRNFHLVPFFKVTFEILNLKQYK